jgi:hypothetical protein
MDQQRPDLSLVVTSANGWPPLEECLTAASRQSGVELEVIVADRCGGDLPAQVRRAFPHVQVLEATPDTTIPELRAMAFRVARGATVAVIEDHVMVPPGWAKSMLDARAAGALVVGGSVENAATDTWIDEAAFLCEYGHLLPPLPAGPVAGLTGNNTLYDRELLERYREVTDGGFWENRLHDAMREDGVELVCHPEISVGHKMHYTFGEYMSQRYLFSRAFTGKRMEGVGAAKRYAFGLASFVLPPVLLWRVGRNLWSKQVDRGLALRSMPLIGFFVLAWAFGDAVGSIFGPGDAPQKVR